MKSHEIQEEVRGMTVGVPSLQHYKPFLPSTGIGFSMQEGMTRCGKIINYSKISTLSQTYMALVRKLALTRSALSYPLLPVSTMGIPQGRAEGTAGNRKAKPLWTGLASMVYRQAKSVPQKKDVNKKQTEGIVPYTEITCGQQGPERGGGWEL